MRLPSKARIDGKDYPINTDYNVALRCFDVIDDPDIGDTERALAVIFLLFGVVPDNHADEFLQAAQKFLSCGDPQEEHQARKKDMDFRQDERYIAASFRSDYGIDLQHLEHMHWWEYCMLINGLTDQCVLNRVRDIRNFDLSTLSDPRSRQDMAEAQERVRLHDRLTADEQAAIDEFEALFL